MGKADWSLDHLEQDLAAGFALLGRAEFSGGLGTGESGAVAEGVLQCMNSALQKVAESLEAQSRLRRELDAEREEYRRQHFEQGRRIALLERETKALRTALDHEKERLRSALAKLPGEEPVPTPPGAHLQRPLVLRSALGEFLGVTDRVGQPLSLAGFLHLVEGQSGARSQERRVVASCWEAWDGGWSLAVSITGPAACRSYVLRTRALRTQRQPGDASGGIA